MVTEDSWLGIVHVIYPNGSVEIKNIRDNSDSVIRYPNGDAYKGENELG